MTLSLASMYTDRLRGGTQLDGSLGDTIIISLVSNNKKGTKGRPKIIGMSFRQLYPEAKLYIPQGSSGLFPKILGVGGLAGWRIVTCPVKLG